MPERLAEHGVRHCKGTWALGYDREMTPYTPGSGWESGLPDMEATFDVADNGPRLPLTGMQTLQQELKGREWVLGIRPEHMLPGQQSAHATLTVDSCELLGADNLAHGRWGKHDVAARLPHEHRPARGEALEVALPAHRLHFFNPATGLRVN